MKTVSFLFLFGLLLVGCGHNCMLQKGYRGKMVGQKYIVQSDLSLVTYHDGELAIWPPNWCIQSYECYKTGFCKEPRNPSLLKKGTILELTLFEFKRASVPDGSSYCREKVRFKAINGDFVGQIFNADRIIHFKPPSSPSSGWSVNFGEQCGQSFLENINEDT